MAVMTWVLRITLVENAHCAVVYVDVDDRITIPNGQMRYYGIKPA
jgi:hypothetical protein